MNTKNRTPDRSMPQYGPEKRRQVLERVLRLPPERIVEVLSVLDAIQSLEKKISDFQICRRAMGPIAYVHLSSNERTEPSPLSTEEWRMLDEHYAILEKLCMRHADDTRNAAIADTTSAIAEEAMDVIGTYAITEGDRYVIPVTVEDPELCTSIFEIIVDGKSVQTRTSIRRGDLMLELPLMDIGMHIVDVAIRGKVATRYKIEVAAAAKAIDLIEAVHGEAGNVRGELYCSY